MFADWVGLMIIVILLVCLYSYASERFHKSSLYGFIKREIWIIRNRKHL